jgi:CrcB protein
MTPTAVSIYCGGWFVKEAMWISIGAILGANARYFVSNVVAKALTSQFPYHTLLINITGSAALGFFFAWSTSRVTIDPSWKLLFAVGFCGTYTTFSTFAYESLALLQGGDLLRFVVNVLGTNALCLLSVALGARLGR